MKNKGQEASTKSKGREKLGEEVYTPNLSRSRERAWRALIGKKEGAKLHEQTEKKEGSHETWDARLSGSYHGR